MFADEEVSAIIRFRHLGPKAEHKTTEPVVESTEPTAPARGEEGGWFGKRLSLQLSNATRSLFLDGLDQQDQNDWKSQPVDLLTGFVQLTGFVNYDPQVISHEKVDPLRKKSAISGKIGGLDGLELTKAANGGFLDKFTGLFQTGINDIDNPQKKEQEETKKQQLETMVPFFSTPKSLLFGEIKLQSGETQTFYFKCRLPMTLPPTYHGKSVRIQYRLVTGASLDRNLPTPINLHFPLNIAQNFNERGYQPVSSLDNFILLSSDKLFNELFQSGASRRSSFKTIKNLILTEPKLTQTNKKDLFMKQLDTMIRADNDSTDFEIEQFKNSDVKENIARFTETLINRGTLDEEEPPTIKKDGYTLEKQVQKLQTQYNISCNGQSITNLTLSKPIYKIGDCIRLHFDFTNKQLTTSGVLTTLESLEMIRDSYATNPGDQARSIQHFKESYATMNHTSLALEIPIPLSATGQFKTSMFECKWALSIKFILVKEKLMSVVHEDTSGVLSFSNDSVAGFEFNCRLPIIILPPNQDFGGIAV